MNESTQPARLQDAWVRWAWIWSVLFYLLLVLPTIVALFDSTTTTTDAAVILALVTVSAVWHWVWAIWLPRRQHEWRQKPARNSIYVLVLTGLWYALVLLHPVLYFLVFSLYSQIFFVLPTTWAISGSILLTILVTYSQTGSIPVSLNNPTTWIWLVSIGGAVIFGLWIHAIIEQSSERRDLIRELEETQDELAAAERRAGMLAERERLARDIHDTLAQGFTSIVMHLEAAEQAVPAGGETATLQRHIDRARRTARDSLDQARRVVRDLKPAPLVDATLSEAIRCVAAKWSGESGIPAKVQITGDTVPLPPDLEVTMLRATQEALANIRKHASASSATITLSYIGDGVILDVQDNGIGIDTNTLNEVEAGFGLNGIRERVEHVNGSLLVESEPGQGTTLVVEIPTT